MPRSLTSPLPPFRRSSSLYNSINLSCSSYYNSINTPINPFPTARVTFARILTSPLPTSRRSSSVYNSLSIQITVNRSLTSPSFLVWRGSSYYNLNLMSPFPGSSSPYNLINTFPSIHFTLKLNWSPMNLPSCYNLVNVPSPSRVTLARGLASPLPAAQESFSHYNVPF